MRTLFLGREKKKRDVIYSIEERNRKEKKKEELWGKRR